METAMDQMFKSIEWEVLPPQEPDASGLPHATHRGILTIMGHDLECVVLSNGQRIFTAESVERLFGGNANIGKPLEKCSQPLSCQEAK